MIRRRLYAEIRVSQLAVWSRQLAFFSLPVLLIAIALHRSGAIEYYPAYALLAATFLVALCAILLALAAFMVIWNDGLKGLGFAFVGLLLGSLVLAYPLVETVRGVTLPAINDIATDTADPPRFNAIAKVRPLNANKAAYPGPAAAQSQRMYYPGVRTIEFDADAEEIFKLAESVATRAGWQIVSVVPPKGGEGTIEAVARTAIMGFREDVVIRLRRTPNGVRVDMRSASRYGQRDFGSNARRIESFLAQLADIRRRGR